MSKPAFHSVIWISSSEMNQCELPALIIDADNPKVMLPAWNYLHSSHAHSKSAAWAEKFIRDIGKCYDFFCEKQANWGLRLSKARNLISAFENHLESSPYVTTDGMYTPVSASTRGRIMHNVRRFASYLQGLEQLDSLFLREMSTAYTYEMEILNWSGLEKSTRFSRLGSDKSSNHDLCSRRQVESFPRHLIPKLILEGCKLTRKRKHYGPISDEYNINLLMALCILAGTGRRKSELFHIWLEDVGTELYHYHPSDGKHFGPGNKVYSRREILRDQYGLRPRHEVRGQKFAGWKSLDITDTTRNKS